MLSPLQNPQIPSHFLCPMSEKIMTDPYEAPCGHSFEYSNIRKWLEASSTCPIDGTSLSSTDLNKNEGLVKSIKEFRKGKLILRKTNDIELKELSTIVILSERVGGCNTPDAAVDDEGIASTIAEKVDGALQPPDFSDEIKSKAKLSKNFQEEKEITPNATEGLCSMLSTIIDICEHIKSYGGVFTGEYI